MSTPNNAATSVRFAFLLCLFGYLSFAQPVFSQSADDANKKTPASQIPDSPSATVVEGDELLDELADEGEETSPFAPGILLQHSNEVAVTREIAFAAADLSDRRLGSIAGPFVWNGYLESEGTGKYTIAATVAGRLRVELDDRVILQTAPAARQWVSSQPIELSYGHHPIRVTFEPRTDVDSQPGVTLFWAGPRFRFEPIPPSSLWHDAGTSPVADSPNGAHLARALRCEACHTFASAHQRALSSPNLATATSYLRPAWLTSFLTSGDPVTDKQPTDAWSSVHAVLTKAEADAVVSWLQSKSQPDATDTFKLGERPSVSKRDAGDRDVGRELMLSLGCLSCHSWNGLGDPGLFGGGDLTDIHRKRTPAFFAKWLANPEEVNSDHRMPVFELSADEIADLSAFLAGEGETTDSAASVADTQLGERLFHNRNCSACHAVGETNAVMPTEKKSRLGKDSNWERSCLNFNRPDGPNYRIESKKVHRAVKQFVERYSIIRHMADGPSSLHENNCLGCHARGDSAGLAPVIQQVAKQHPALVNRLPAMQPPALNSVGDKLLDKVLGRSIARSEPPRRDWLAVRMPRFPLKASEVDALAAHFIQHDRVPDDAVVVDENNDAEVADAFAADRLVTSEGFGCVSCHAIGNVRPPTSTPLGQLAPSLSMPQTRMRKTWFDRWVRNPARITPRMEMPSVQIPIPGLMDNDLDRQLNALWNVLNVRRFSPPDPAPTRILAQSGHPSGRALVLTDVFRFNNRKLIKPLLVGLPNRRNVLFDLQAGRLAGQWLGDTAQQRTQGKTWFWESPVIEVAESAAGPEIVLLRGDQVIQPVQTGQAFCELDGWFHIENGVRFEYRMRFPAADGNAATLVRISQRVVATDDGWQRTILLSNLPAADSVGMLIDYGKPEHNHQRVNHLAVVKPNQRGEAKLELRYRDPAESRPSIAAATSTQSNLADPAEASDLDIVAGFHATQLPLRKDVMPISLGWQPNGQLLVGSLKGRVWRATDRDEDQLEDTLTPISDDLASPYGIQAGEDHVDVVTKYGVVRLSDFDESGLATSHELVATGWGHTDDYHDWVVGLPRDANGNYFVSIPCQQDERSDAAARYRGAVLRLSPRKPDSQNPRQFEVTPVSMGHRFPMGIARNRSGQMFVTDNQGNYNPYNELNHVTPGARFGFINRLDRRDGFNPPLTPPAINIPHPWTRSVNGICFLETPTQLQDQGERLYGPFEGHLIGCEYDTRRLIRMTIETVDGWVQGAAYPFAESTSDASKGLQGPINCGIAPDGDIYIANIRDSGWGGANNTGSIVRMSPNLNRLPAGIAEVSAVRGGFRITFTRPVNRLKAADVASYSVVSATRESTPAYGGDDLNRRSEAIRRVSVAPDAKSVTVQLEELREGFVYEFRLKSLVDNPDRFYPAEAFYSLTRRRR